MKNNLIKTLKQRNNTFKYSEYGVAGIVIAVLMIGLIITMFAIIQTVYVPSWMEQLEAEHMEDVSNQFGMLKYAIDVQSIIETPNSPISTSITLGNKEIPFFISNKAFGFLEIQSDKCIITITDSDDNENAYPAGIIYYSSENSYYMNQNFIFESGAIITSQQQGAVMSVKPLFVIEPNGVNTYKITFNVIDINCVGDKRSAGGYGTYPIQTDFSRSTTIDYYNIKNITITTRYINPWKNFLRNKFLSEGFLEESSDDWTSDTDFRFSSTDDSLILEINPDSVYKFNMELKYIRINAQIAPGWIG